jgi:phage FluMu protein Com
MKQKTIVKIIKCPKCGKIFESKGYPGALLTVICPNCLTKGFFRFRDDELLIPKEKNKAYILSYIPYILIIVVILISHFMLSSNDLFTFIAFITLIPIFVSLQYDGRIAISYALLMFGLTGITIGFIKNETFANQLAIYAYWLLVVGVACLLIKSLREQRTSKPKNSSS